ncbi:MAG: type transport system permease protein [Mycobacteriales bacterium]|jgi:ABC-2 type transport system permease protein
MKLLRDTWLIFQRQMLLVFRTPIRLVIGFVQPIAYLVLFAPLLKPALAPMGARTYADAYRIYVPGLLIVLVLFSGFFTGFSLLAELRAGIIERSRVTPVSRFALLLGRALAEVATMMGQAVLITLLVIPFHLGLSIGPLLLAYLLLTLMGLFASAVSYAMALRIKNVAALGPLVNTVSQPLALLSGVLLPLTLAPIWLIRIARWNPFYWATNGVRALFAGDVGNSAVWQALVINLTLSLLAVFWATRMFAHRVR